MLKVFPEKSYPVIPLRDIVVFPHMIVPLFVGRERSVRALEYVMEHDDKYVFLVTQKAPSQDSPAIEDLYSAGTIANIIQMLKLPDGTVKVLVEGIKRARAKQYEEQNGFFVSSVRPIKEVIKDPDEVEALSRTLISQFEQYIKLNKKIPPDVLVSINQIDDPSKLADTIASYFSLKIADKQDLLEIGNVGKRLEKILLHIGNENNILEVENRIRTRVKRQMEKTQREYYLNEQLKAIHKELGEGEDGKDEIQEIEEKANKLKLSKEAKAKVLSEIKKLKQMNSSSAEATVIRTYLDWILSIPWEVRSKIKKSLKTAKAMLDKDHYGLEKVKERIIEHLAVHTRVGKVTGQILCLIGPPGVGKTSLAKSIAEATGRNFVRVSLGGIRDEAEIRGHRRTYIGSMPGKIIQGMKKAKTSNPLILLDEIDKIGSDWKGDPASALLEVLDPEQNSNFNDHYLEIDYDLSDVMFIATANTMQMPQPLIDRLEIIRIPGYTEQEKSMIARKHLISKQLRVNGLKEEELTLSDAAIHDLIKRYTRESGVRNLEREIANIARKVVKEIVTKHTQKVSVTENNLGVYAGIPKYSYGQIEQSDAIGVSTGMAWTEVGGDLLSIEVLILPGSGKTQFTGKLGDVMQESMHAALSYLKSKSESLKIDQEKFKKVDIHIHVPEGAIPKDGPSAGTAMFTALASAFTKTPVNREVAMTGELTLRGKVLAIGGLKEKMLAAHRGGIKTVIIPKENEKDLEDIPFVIKKELEIKTVQFADEILPMALVREEAIVNKKTIKNKENSTSKGVNHLPHQVKGSCFSSNLLF